MPWLFLAYPLLAHLATLLHSEGLAGVALATFIAVPILPLLLRGQWQAWLILLMAGLGLWFGARSGWAHYLMYLPPILIPLSVLWLFARSLRPDSVPVVTRVATKIRGPLPEELTRYTRQVTQFWVGFLILMSVGSLLLAIFASAELWSLMTNIVLYLLMASVFVFEYLYRRWRFRHLEHESFATMIGALLTTRMH
ncbi:MAG: hypothetical protein QM808_01025 [Steroidobacteraceae bacterium]